MSLLSAIGSAVAGGAGQLVNAGVNLWSGHRAEKSAAADRQVAIDQFNSQMDDTLQRRVADGLKAGINPLAAIGASANVSPTFHAGGGSDGPSFFARAGEHLSKLFERKQEDDLEYDRESKKLDLESKRLENRILRNKANETGHNVKQGAATEVPSESPSRLGEKPLFSVVYDLQDRPRLVVNQDVLEGDSDNAGYMASLKHAYSQNFIDSVSGKVNNEGYRQLIDQMYYDMTGRHISNLSELYFSPAEVAAAAANLVRGI